MADPKKKTGDDSGVILKERSEEKAKRPRKWKVIIVNDDYTPMQFVVDLLREVFRKSEAEATRVMMQIHTQGSAVCGVYTHEIAETKVAVVTMRATQAEYPLMAVLDPE
jgi:ATP-dependent Clp protease adaptor protein ClpS